MIIYGKNPVWDILKYCPDLIKEIYLLNTEKSKKFGELIKLAEHSKINISVVEKGEIDRLTSNSNHQGIAADTKDFEYTDFSQIAREEFAFYLILDHIEDPHNLGAIIRTAVFFGVDCMVIPKDRAAGITPTVIKTSSGSAVHIPICRVSNIGNAIRELKKSDVWVVGADPDAKQSVFESSVGDLKIALVIGSEGKGLGRKTKDQCDFLFSIPKFGNVDSLNASVATGVMIYELKKKQLSG